MRHLVNVLGLLLLLLSNSVCAQTATNYQPNQVLQASSLNGSFAGKTDYPPPASVIAPSGTTCQIGAIAKYQQFANTTSAPAATVLGISDGAACVPWATLNETTHSLTITATSGINAKNFAKGDTASFTDGRITSGQSTLSSVSHPCVTGRDPGHYIVLHGSGVAAAAQFGTVTACNGVNYTVSFTAATTILTGGGTAGFFTIGTDDTAGIVNAIAAANGSCVYFPPGAYWLASQSTPISLSNSCLLGDATQPFLWPYTAGGSVLLISDTATPAFSLGTGVTVSGMTFYWPLQDSVPAAPVVYPALFESATIGKVLIEKSTFVDPYTLIKVDTGGLGLGDVRLANVRAYCILYCFQFANGAPDILQIINSEFSIAAYSDVGVGLNLDKFTAANGEFVHSDVGGGGGTTSISLQLTNSVIHNYRYGIRLISGTLVVSNINGNGWDNTPTMFSVEGTAAITTTTVAGNQIYGLDAFTPTAAENLFNFTSTSNVSELNISGNYISYAMGHVISDTGAALRDLVLTGNTINNWGQSSTVSTYDVFTTVANAGLQLTASGNVIRGGVVNGNTVVGLGLNGGVTNVSGNTFNGLSTPVILSGSGVARHLIQGNTSLNTGAAVSFSDTSSGSASVSTTNNFWDKPRAPAVATGNTDCGTGPSFGPNSDDWLGTLTVGATPGGQCTLTFNSTSGRVPICFVYDATSPFNVLRSSVVSIKSVAFVGTLVAGDVLGYSCVR